MMPRVAELSRMFEVTRSEKKWGRRQREKHIDDHGIAMITPGLGPREQFVDTRLRRPLAGKRLAGWRRQNLNVGFNAHRPLAARSFVRNRRIGRRAGVLAARADWRVAALGIPRPPTIHDGSLCASTYVPHFNSFDAIVAVNEIGCQSVMFRIISFSIMRHPAHT